FLASRGGPYPATASPPASSAVLLQPVTPVMVVVGARFYLREQLHPRQWLGVACSALGVVLIITKGSWHAVTHLDLRPGDFLLLVSSMGWAAYTVYGKRVLARHSPTLPPTTPHPPPPPLP